MARCFKASVGAFRFLHNFPFPEKLFDITHGPVRFLEESLRINAFAVVVLEIFLLSQMTKQNNKFSISLSHQETFYFVKPFHYDCYFSLSDVRCEIKTAERLAGILQKHARAPTQRKENINDTWWGWNTARQFPRASVTLNRWCRHHCEPIKPQ